jgi:1-acyl-sn-glycerol-3-phosphate acyltransferase
VGAYYSSVRLLAAAVLGALSRWEVKGRGNIPRAGALVIASNHASFWDPPLVGAAVPRELHFLAKEELFSSRVLGPMIRSVNSIPIRRGAADLSGLTRAIETVKRGGALLVFPEGSRMRDGALHPARPGIGLIAVQGDARIVPCYVSGSNRPGRWWLPGMRVRIWFGAARHWRELAGEEADQGPDRALYRRLGQAVMGEIARLKSEQEQSASLGAA